MGVRKIQYTAASEYDSRVMAYQLRNKTFVTLRKSGELDACRFEANKTSDSCLLSTSSFELSQSEF